MNKTFLKNKVQRQINQNGQTFVFKRNKIDKFGQVSDELLKEIKVKGIFHTTNSYVKEKDGDGSKITSKQQPMILSLFDESHEVLEDDFVEVNDKIYIVTDINDVNDFGVVCDISLRLVK